MNLKLNRRQFIAGSLAAVASLELPAWSAQSRMARYWVARCTRAPDIAVPNAMRAPFGWELRTVSDRAHPALELSWSGLRPGGVPTHFRFAVGLDERDEKVVEAFLPKSGRVIGHLDLRFVSQFQPYELPLAVGDVNDIVLEGLGLRLAKGSDLEIITGGTNAPEALMPHLLVPGTAGEEAEFLARMNSLAVVQQFGWMEGCVLDGLLDLAASPQHTALKHSAKEHLALFFKEGHLVYENHVCAPSDDRIYGIEGTLPFAALARVEPENPLLELAVRFWKARRRPSGSIQDGATITSEGAYTVGYALAEVAKARESAELMRMALQQVKLRQESLFDGREFFRTRTDTGKGGNRNWARGIAWQILGLSRTLVVARDREDTANLVQSLRTFAAWVINFQRKDGLWSVFVDDPSLTPDTAGSAGIAAALAIGVKQGWLEADAREAAGRTLVRLQKHLTADGFLGGVSQSNKGGEALQRSDYRSLYQMGMGLMAQLMAGLEK